MKQTDIRIGQVYELGRDDGQHGVSAVGIKIRVLEKGLSKYENWTGGRLDHVKVVLLNEDGTDRLIEKTNSWIKDEDVGKPVTRLIPAKKVLDPRAVEAEREVLRKQHEERAERARQTEAYRAEIAGKIEAFFGITSQDYSISTKWDFEAEAPEIRSISFHNNNNGLVALLRKIIEPHKEEN